MFEIIVSTFDIITSTKSEFILISIWGDPVAWQSPNLGARLSGLLRCMLYLYIIQRSFI